MIMNWDILFQTGLKFPEHSVPMLVVMARLRLHQQRPLRKQPSSINTYTAFLYKKLLKAVNVFKS